MARILTLQQLLDAGACEDQIQAFQTRFGEQVTVTPEVAHVFDIYWAVKCLLSHAARAEYQRIVDVAWVEYQQGRLLPTQYWRMGDAARAEYLRIRDIAWAEYERARVAAFAQAYNADEPTTT